MDWNALAWDYQNGAIPFDNVYNALAPQLHPVARKFKLFGHDIEDLIQIAMVSIYRSIHRFRSGCFLGFARQIARRRILDIVKVQRKERLLRNYSQPDEESDLRFEQESKREISPFLHACIKEEAARREERLRLIDGFCLESRQQVLNALYLSRRQNRPLHHKPKVVEQRDICTAYLRRIIRLDDNRTFENVIDAAKDSRASKLSLVNAANHGYTCGKSKWRWA